MTASFPRPPSLMAGPTRQSALAECRSRAENLAQTLPPLLVAAERVASTVSQGVHGRRRVGDGEAFWQFRRYQWGDPTQRIDWRQSAKSDRIYVRECEWEAAQSVWLWHDRSTSMNWRSSTVYPTKRDRAELLLLALAALLIRGGERVAYLGAGVPPSTGRTALRRLFAELLAEGVPDQGIPHLEALPRYARVVWFGDFLGAPEILAERVTAFARRGIAGHLILIVDPAEERLPYSGRIRFDGGEGEHPLTIGRVESVRDEYLAAFRAHQASVRDIAHRMSWRLLTHHTDRPPETALLNLYVSLSDPKV